MAGLFVVILVVFKESIRSSKVHPLVRGEYPVPGMHSEENFSHLRSREPLVGYPRCLRGRFATAGPQMAAFPVSHSPLVRLDEFNSTHR